MIEEKVLNNITQQEKKQLNKIITQIEKLKDECLKDDLFYGPYCCLWYALEKIKKEFKIN